MVYFRYLLVFKQILMGEHQGRNEWQIYTRFLPLSGHEISRLGDTGFRIGVALGWQAGPKVNRSSFLFVRRRLVAVVTGWLGL